MLCSATHWRERALQLLGARRYATMVEGVKFEPAVGMVLYLDAAGVDGLGQLFLAYERAKRFS